MDKYEYYKYMTTDKEINISKIVKIDKLDT